MSYVVLPSRLDMARHRSHEIWGEEKLGYVGQVAAKSDMYLGDGTRC